MKCLHCGKRVLAFRLFSGGEVFCSEEHGNLHRKNEAASAIQRILTLDAPKKPLLRVTPVMVEIQPAPVETPPPAPAGFRLPVLEPVGALSDPLPRLELMGSVIEATEIRLSPLALAVGLEGFSFVQAPEWRASASTVVRWETAVSPAGSCRVPSVPAAAIAGNARPGQFSPPLWRPIGDGAAAAPEWLALQMPKPAQTAADPLQIKAPGPGVASAAWQTAWLPLADRMAGPPLASPLRAEQTCAMVASLSTPRWQEKPFASTWTARPSYSLWMSACPISADAALISDGMSDGMSDGSASGERPLSSYRLPAPRQERDARPACTGTVRLWVPIADKRPWMPEIATPASTGPIQPALAWTEASAIAPSPFAALDLARCRPWPAVTRVTPETALELSAWTAWPELPTARLAITHTARLFPACIAWRANPGSLSRAALSRLRLLDAPERCLSLSVVPRASLAPALPPAALAGQAHAWPLSAVAPLASPSAISGMLPPAESVRWPVKEAEVSRRPGRRMTLAAVAPPAQAPARPGPVSQPALSREEVALRALGVSPKEYSSTPRRLAAPAVRPAALRRASPELDSASAVSPNEIGGGVRQPVGSATRVCAVPAVWRTSPPWAGFDGGRPLERASAQEREVPLRLSLEEIPPQCTLELRAREAQPGTVHCAILPLVWQTASRDFPDPATAVAAEPLRQPGIVASISATLPGARLNASGWTARVAAADPVVRRRQLPASRPKMNWPKAAAPAQPPSVSAPPFEDGSWSSVLAKALAQDSPIEHHCQRD